MVTIEEVEDYYYKLHQLKMKLIALQGNQSVELNNRDIRMTIDLINLNKDRCEKWLHKHKKEGNNGRDSI